MTVVKIDRTTDLEITPADGGCVLLQLKKFGATLGKFVASAETASQVVAATQQALNTVKLPPVAVVTDVRVNGVRCHGDACLAGQLECPHKAACGVKP